MSVVFSVIGTCRAEAVFWVGAYSRREGRVSGSPDVVVYACEEHAGAAGAEWLAGLASYGVRSVPGRHCGQVTTCTEADEPVVGEPVTDGRADGGAAGEVWARYIGHVGECPECLGGVDCRVAERLYAGWKAAGGTVGGTLGEGRS
jgi:hypothetical protein